MTRSGTRSNPLNLVSVMLLFAAVSWPQQVQSTTPTTYALEPIVMSPVAYPPEARQRSIQGRVVAMMLVSESGDVEAVQVFRADPVLSQAAKEAIGKWKFKPVTKSGEAVPAIAKVTLSFVLDGNQPIVTPEMAPADEFPQHVRVSDTVMQGLVISTPPPAYPAAAKASHVRGTVKLDVIIGKDGTVKDVQVVSGAPELVQTSTEGVRQWRYRPYRFLGRPVEVQTTVQVNFH